MTIQKNTLDTERHAILTHQVCNLFGGNSAPKLAEKQTDVRRDKEDAMVWIKNEIKRYDQAETLMELENRLETTITKIQKE